MTLVEQPEPDAALNDVVVQVHASGFTPGECTARAGAVEDWIQGGAP